MSIRLLTYAKFKANAARDPQWKSWEERWVYHAKAVEIVSSLGITRGRQVIEIGSFGAGLVEGSDRYDLPDGPWRISGDRVTIAHDARALPWPVETGKYELLSALRVWHHLAPVQEPCFREAKRIARRVLIECPEQEVVGQGIPEREFRRWHGADPMQVWDMGAWGKLYLFGGGHAEKV